jgi:hypothetical protein
MIATTGPNSPISNGSLIPGIESQADFALAFVKKLQTQDLRYVVVTQEAADEFNEWKNEFMKGMTWGASCTSWYVSRWPMNSLRSKANAGNVGIKTAHLMVQLLVSTPSMKLNTS